MLQMARVSCLGLLLWTLACSNNPFPARQPDESVHPACKRFILKDSPDIEPPRIINGRVVPPVPYKYRVGYVCVHGTVNLKGKLVGVEILDTNDEDYAKALVSAMSKWRYSPAIRNGVPVRVRVFEAVWYIRRAA